MLNFLRATIFARFLACFAFSISLSQALASTPKCESIGTEFLETEYRKLFGEFQANTGTARLRIATLPKFSEGESMLKRAPQLSGVIDRVEYGLQALRAGPPKKANLNDQLDELIRRRNALADYAQSASNFFRNKGNDVADLLQEISRKLRLQEKDVEKFRERIEQNENSGTLLNAIETSLITQWLGYLGEVQIAIRVPNLQAKSRKIRAGFPSQLENLKKSNPNLTAEDILKFASQETESRLAKFLSEHPNEQGNEVLDQLTARLLDKEIDVIFKPASGAEAWGEVKNYFDVIDMHLLKDNYGGRRKSIYEQATENAIIAKSLRTKERPIELHHFLINGITPEAAGELQRLGITVHGIILLPQ